MKSLKFFWAVLLMLTCPTAAVFAQGTPPPQAQQGAGADKGAQKDTGGKGSASDTKGAADNKGTADKGTADKGTADKGTNNNKATSTALKAKPDHLDFPAQQLSSTEPPQKTVTVTNTSTADVVIQNVLGSKYFEVDAPAPMPQTLLKGGSIIIAVRFKPEQDGNASGVLRVQTDKGDVLDVPLSGATYPPLGGLCSFSPGAEVRFIFWISLIYWLAMVVVRWHRIANPTRELLRGQIATLHTELDMLPNPATTGPTPGVSDWRQKIHSVIEDASREISPKAAGRSRIYRLANFLFWSRGEEITGWGYVHDAEVKMVDYQLIPTVMARLEAAEQKLRLSNDPPCLALANTIHTALTATQPPTDESRLRALLAQALSTLGDRSDTSFADLVSWQNKASWLVGCGLFVLLILTIAIPQHSILLVVGAAGGLISRMSRSLNRKDVPTDYGASWTTLFLSPVSGALGAWAGILVSDLAAKLNVLGPLFQADFTDVCRPSTLAIAFVFGFSERLLDGMLDKLEDKSGATPPKNPQPPQKTVPPATPSGGGGAGLKITTQKLDDGMVTQPYNAQLQASGAGGNVTWSVKNGSLPDGLDLTPSGPQAGSIAGTPKVANSFAFTVSVTDGSSTTDQQLTIVIKPTA